MATQNKAYLKKLFSLLQSGKVVSASWLEEIGISRDLQKYYLTSGWLESLGRGVYKKPNDLIEWHGALESIQKQTNSKIHIGALTALSIQGLSHYFRLGTETVNLFSSRKEKLPKWFMDYNWGAEIIHTETTFIATDQGIKLFDFEHSQVLTSTPERAIMECLYLSPDKIDLVECYHLFEGLVNLKPKLVNDLLMTCNSVKVKRLFLYMAEKANHQWFKFLNLDKFDLGKGSRCIVKDGVYQAKYLISVPREIAEL
jgi:hypothetical protein